MACLPVLGWRRESIFVIHRPNVSRRMIWERRRLQETESRRIALEQLDQQRAKPWMLGWRRHRSEPHQPVESEMIGGDLRRQPGLVSWLALELVRLPVSGSGSRIIVGAFDHDLVPLLGNAAECAVGV